MTLTSLPTAPSRADPANFATRADAMMAALPVMVTEINSHLPVIEQARTVGADVANARADCLGYASSAAQSAALAAAVAGGSVGSVPTSRPSLVLDFALGESVDARLTFTRSSTASRINRLGILETVAANTPRIQYDQATKECLGILIELAATNLCTYSADFTQAAWAVTNATKGTGVADPWGGSTAATVTATAGSASMQNGNAGVVNIGTTYTVSCWIRRRTGTGAVGIRVVENENTIEVPVTTTWARFSATMTATQTAGRCGVFVRESGDAIDVWGFQLEAGGVPSSYIATTAAAVTRAVDSCTMAGSEFSAWFAGPEGSLIVDAYGNSHPDQTIAAEIYSGATHRISVGAAASSKNGFGLVRSDDGVVANMNKSKAWTGFGRVALAYKANDFAFSHDGLSAATDTAGTVAAPTALMVGGQGDSTANRWCGCIRRIAYYPRRLANAELQGLTAI